MICFSQSIGAGSFALSFLNENAEINHFRITAICGDFYIGGRRFTSLKQLVGYYTAFVDLLKNERLVFPVPPPEVREQLSHLNFVCVCVCDYLFNNSDQD